MHAIGHVLKQIANDGKVHMNQLPPGFAARIQSICPDLMVQTATLNQDGLVNDVVIVNGDTIFRFAKNDAGVRAMATELRILDLLRPHLHLAIPAPFHQGEGEMAYPLLPGVPLTHIILAGLDEANQQAVADQLAEFLYTLHTLPLPTAPPLPVTLAPSREDRMAMRRRVEEKIYPLLLPHQRQWAQALFDRTLNDPQAFAYAAALVHGDLGPHHILFDPVGQRISGVLDFGVGGVGDSAIDIALCLINYGESFVRRMQAHYPTLAQWLPHARFYASLLELEWVLLGLETGETFWFTAHLGNARDIMI